MSLAFLGILFILAWFCEEIFRAILSDESTQMLFQEYVWVYWFSVRPLEKLCLAAKKMSEGNFEEEIQGGSSDEIGELASLLEKIRLNVKTLSK